MVARHWSVQGHRPLGLESHRTRRGLCVSILDDKIQWFAAQAAELCMIIRQARLGLVTYDILERQVVFKLHDQVRQLFKVAVSGSTLVRGCELEAQGIS